MATYIGLLNWTEQGIKNFKDTVDRYESAQAAFGDTGVSFKDAYWTLGSYDIVAILEAPDDESATAAMLALGGQGNVRTTTLRAFSASEMRGVLEKAG
jgi:uncharacterized protein with GYD domain